MTSRRLERIYPIEVMAFDSSLMPDLEVTSALPNRWEGTVLLDGNRSVPFLAYREGQQVYVWISGESYVFTPASPTNTRSSRTDQSVSDEIICPVPGVVIAIQVAVGDMVEAGQELVVIESMKTEQIIKSPRDGTIERVSVQKGDRVDRGMRLVVLTSVAETE